MVKKLIFSIEDNESIREIVACAMQASGMEVETFADSMLMFERIEVRRPDLILLDIMLPGIDGVESLKRLKASQYAHIPVIMLSAKTAEYDKVALLDLGAADYMTKPFGVLELIARVKANLKRQSTQIFEWSGYSVNGAKREIAYHGEVLTLTVKEYETLKMLILAQGEPVDKDNMLSTIWSDDYEGEARTLNMVILRLRGKLKPEAIETVRNVGFRLRN